MNKIVLLAGTSCLVSLALPAPAAAAPVTCEGYAVTVLDGWTECAGFYDKNIFNNGLDVDRDGIGDNVELQIEAVTFLGGSFDGNFGSLYGFGSISSSVGPRVFDLGKIFYGKTIIGAHFGNIGLPDKKIDYGNVSAFYLFDFGATGGSSLNFVQSRGLSNLYVYNGNAVPEPGTWAMLILGFGLVGGALRGFRRQRPALNYT